MLTTFRDIWTGCRPGGHGDIPGTHGPAKRTGRSFWRHSNEHDPEARSLRRLPSQVRADQEPQDHIAQRENRRRPAWRLEASRVVEVRLAPTSRKSLRMAVSRLREFP